MRITKDVLTALRLAINDAGSQRELAKQAGASESNISQYLSGKVKKVSDENWDNLYPLLSPYLDDDPRLSPIETKIMEIIKQIPVPDQLDVLEYLAANYGAMKLKHAKAG